MYARSAPSRESLAMMTGFGEYHTFTQTALRGRLLRSTWWMRQETGAACTRMSEDPVNTQNFSATLRYSVTLKVGSALLRRTRATFCRQLSRMDGSGISH